ncbi:TatD family hydrolase [bacterium]|nr:TatD family hydrolase [bacterium]
MFDKQMKLARKYNLPVVIHSRDDFEPTYEILENYKDLKIYVHCR